MGGWLAVKNLPRVAVSYAAAQQGTAEPANSESTYRLTGVVEAGEGSSRPSQPPPPPWPVPTGQPHTHCQADTPARAYKQEKQGEHVCFGDGVDKQREEREAGDRPDYASDARSQQSCGSPFQATCHRSPCLVTAGASGAPSTGT